MCDNDGLLLQALWGLPASRAGSPVNVTTIAERVERYSERRTNAWCDSELYVHAAEPRMIKIRGGSPSVFGCFYDHRSVCTHAVPLGLVDRLDTFVA